MTNEQFIVKKEEWDRFELLFPKGLCNPPVIRDYGALEVWDYDMSISTDVGIVCRLLNDFWCEIEKYRRGGLE